MDRTTKYKFGDQTYDSLGKLVIRMPVTDTYFVCIKAQIVHVDVPLLLGLDVLRRLKVILDFDKFTMTSTKGHWSVQLKRKLRHAYVEWADNILYTETELRKMHRHFYHPSTDKLFKMIKRAEPTNEHPGMHEVLEKIKETCDTCQRNGNEPHRFRVAMPPENCVFNRMVSLDIISLDLCAVLHMVDRDTRFGASSFLSGESAAQVWKFFVNTWISAYIGFPDCVALDQGPEFRSN